MAPKVVLFPQGRTCLISTSKKKSTYAPKIRSFDATIYFKTPHMCFRVHTVCAGIGPGSATFKLKESSGSTSLTTTTVNGGYRKIKIKPLNIYIIVIVMINVIQGLLF